MNMRFDLSSHLGKEIFNSLRSAPFQPYLLDYGIPEVKSFNRGLVLALSLLFSKDFKIFPKGSRIGVILPPGIAGFVSNFAFNMIFIKLAVCGWPRGIHHDIYP